MSFNDFYLKNEINLAIAKLGYIKPTPIQSAAIPQILENKDILGRSNTGTGKTAAFLLPILQQLDTNLLRNQTLIVCPTRDLAVQISSDLKKFAINLKNVKLALLIGGASIKNQLRDLKTSNVVIGTPGRITDHLNRKSLRLSFLKTIVLDETDEMIKMGFKENIDSIFACAPKNIQTILFSATISKPVLKITANYQNNPVEINLNNEIEQREQKNLKQFYFDTKNASKEKALIALYQELNPQLSIIFSNTKAYTTKLQKLLQDHNIAAATITGDNNQRERAKAVNTFKSGQVKVLIATDLMARGIHVDGVDYVFNFDIPKEKEYYIHRIGRTARAGATGTAITLINDKKTYLELKNIEKFQNQAINKLETSIELPVTKKSIPSRNFKHNNRQNNNRQRFYN